MSSINHSSTTSSDVQWWSQCSTMESHPQNLSSSHSNNLNLKNQQVIMADDHHEEEEEYTTTTILERRREINPLFEKPLTPSDVGRLNRLVIPKQHAERHFPLKNADKLGLLLSFDDELGKCWRFRYSYWDRSQSYLLTKGWSRFVKEKSLDAGDVVLFLRHGVDGGRMFIGGCTTVCRPRGGGGDSVAACSNNINDSAHAAD